MHPDHQKYAKFNSRNRLEKSVNSLMGILQGIALDGTINASEIALFKVWLEDHEEIKNLQPFTELIILIEMTLDDGVLAEDERQDIFWLCGRLLDSAIIDEKADIQRLHAILGSICFDNTITKEELSNLSLWMQDHEYLKKKYPYDEVESLITSTMSDKVIDDIEQKRLICFFNEFIPLLDGKTIIDPGIMIGGKVIGLCSVCPEIKFAGSRFCFTGASSRYTRDKLAEIAQKLGGEVTSSVSKNLDYLVIGAEGNPYWAFACYGRKVEKAVEVRKSGGHLQIVHENDFHDAVADQRP